MNLFSMLIRSNNNIHQILIHRNDTIFLAIIFYFSMFVRIIYYIINPVISRDSASYMYYALKIDPAYNPHLFVPFYQMILTQIGYFASSRYFCLFAIAMNIILGSATAIMLYLLTRLFFSWRISFFSALLYSIHPTYVRLSVQIQREMIYILFGMFFFLSLCLIIKDIRFSIKRSFCCGLFCGLSAVSRIEGLEFILVFIAVLFICFFESFSWKNLFFLINSFIVFLIAFSFVVIIVFYYSDLDMSNFIFLIYNHLSRRFHICL